MIEDNRTNTKMRAHYNTFFLARRLMTVVVLIYLERFPYFQCALLMLMSGYNLIYIFVHQPLLSRNDNRQEIFNEGCILASCYLTTNYLNIAMPVDFKDQLGYISIGVGCLSIGVNVATVILSTVSSVWTSIIEAQATYLAN